MTKVSGLSAVLCIRNEERQLADCLSRLAFADELVVVLDRSTDGSKAVAATFGARIIEGAYEREGERRNTGIAAAKGPWILEVDADERITPTLAAEIAGTIGSSQADRHLIPVDNYVGKKLIRHGWGGAFGKGAYVGLFRKGVKIWGNERVHPKVQMSGKMGPRLQSPLEHYVDRNIADMMARLDRYTTLRARDLRDRWRAAGAVDETMGRNVRRIAGRFYKCYWRRKGYREGKWGFLIALMAALYPILSYLKAVLEDE